VLRVWRANDGLNMGEISWLPADRELALPERYAHLADTVRRALEDLSEHYEHVEKKFDDAAWIGARLTELLPIELADKQALLELDDPIERLDSLLTVVPAPD
jgi:Lon protease-like protein